MKAAFQAAARLSLCPHKQIFNSTPDLQGSTIQCFQHLFRQISFASSSCQLPAHVWLLTGHSAGGCPVGGKYWTCLSKKNGRAACRMQELWCKRDNTHYGKVHVLWKTILLTHMCCSDKEAGESHNSKKQTCSSNDARWNYCVSYHPHRNRPGNKKLFDAQPSVMVSVMSPGCYPTSSLSWMTQHSVSHCLQIWQVFRCGATIEGVASIVSAVPSQKWFLWLFDLPFYSVDAFLCATATPKARCFSSEKLFSKTCWTSCLI